MTSPNITIGERCIGRGCRPYVIAELSANHNGDFNRAIEILEAAAAAGADAVKLQTYTADTMTIDHDGPGFRIEGGLWRGRSLYDLYLEAHTPWEWHEPLFRRGKDLGVHVFSSPFDVSAVDFLETLNPPAYKIASFEIVDLPLIRRVARTGKPLIISTGMADLSEIHEALEAAKSAGAKDVALLHCLSGYPTPPTDANLTMIPLIERAFGVTVGFSDHTYDVGVPLAAIAHGASIVEKHLTLSRKDGGADAAFSAEPAEFEILCRNAPVAHEASLQGGGFRRGQSEMSNRLLRRSLYVVEDLSEGAVLTASSLRAIRPGLGLPPKYYETLLGRRVSRPVRRGTPMSWDILE